MSFGTDLTISIDLAAENQDDRQRGDERRGEKWCETERVTVDDRRRELKGCEQNGEGDGNGFVESIRLSTLVEKGTNGGKKEQKVVVHQRLLDEDWRGGKQEQPYPSFLDLSCDEKAESSEKKAEYGRNGRKDWGKGENTVGKGQDVGSRRQRVLKRVYEIEALPCLDVL